MTTPSVYSFMSNVEQKLYGYIQGRKVKAASLAKTIQQCGETFLRDPSFLKWLESLPWTVRYTDNYLQFGLFSNNLSSGLTIEEESMR